MTHIVVDDPEWFDENERFTELESLSGTTRETFLGEEWVYKRPLYGGAVRRNQMEADHYAAQVLGTELHDGYQGVPIAECYLLSDGTLKMRRVKRIKSLVGKNDVDMPEDRLPEWAWRVDNLQVGLDDKGQIVAYDL